MDPDLTMAALAKEAEREVGERRRVYRRLVAQGKLDQQKAERQIAQMKRIAELLYEAAERNPQASGLLL